MFIIIDNTIILNVNHIIDVIHLDAVRAEDDDEGKGLAERVVITTTEQSDNRHSSYKFYGEQAARIWAAFKSRADYLTI